MNSSQESCLICGDVASGKHYGLRSCEACKAFFKRTVQGKIEYSCPATRECEINKRRRKACQACRFQKCLNMGMLKEGVRLDRVRGGRQKYRRGLSPGPNRPSGMLGGVGGGVSSNANTNNCNNSLVNSSSTSSSSAKSNSLNNMSNSVACSINNMTGSLDNSSAGSVPIMSSSINALPHAISSSDTHRIMTALINCEPEELTASPAQFVTNIPSTLSVQMKTLYLLSDLFDRELVSLIGWAKQIPGFSENITLNDQMRLLQSTWAEIIALSIGYRSHLRRIGQTSNASYDHENIEIKLVFAKDLIVDFKHALACGAEEIFYNCVQLIKRLDYLKIKPKEYILLKAISLTNADVRLENPKTTHQLRDLIMETLYESTATDEHSVDGYSHFNNSNSSNSSNSTSSSNNNHQTANSSSATLGSMSGLHQHAVKMESYATSPSRPSSSSLTSSSTPILSISSQNNGSGGANSNIINNNNTINTQNTANRDIASARFINHRLNQLTLCLPVLRQIDSCIRRFWNDVRKGPNPVPMNKLFEEMLEPCQRIYKSSFEM